MQQERELRSARPEARYNCDGSLRKPPELMSQLALKRGAQRRGTPQLVDLSKREVKSALMSPKLNTRLLHQREPMDMLSQLHWFDDLQECALPPCCNMRCVLQTHQG